MLFRKGVGKASGLVISDKKDFTDSSRQQRQSSGHFCVGLMAPPRPCDAMLPLEQLRLLCSSPSETLCGCLGPHRQRTSPPCVLVPYLCWLLEGSFGSCSCVSTWCAERHHVVTWKMKEGSAIQESVGSAGHHVLVSLSVPSQPLVPFFTVHVQLCCTASPQSYSKSNPKDPGRTSRDGRVPIRVWDSVCLDLVCEQASEGMTKCLKVWILERRPLTLCFLDKVLLPVEPYR